MDEGRTKKEGKLGSFWAKFDLGPLFILEDPKSGAVAPIVQVLQHLVLIYIYIYIFIY